MPLSVSSASGDRFAVQLKSVRAGRVISKNFRPSSAAFLAASATVALLVYLAIAWLLFPPGALWSPDEGAKLMQIQNLRLTDGRLAYDIVYSGRELDPDLQFAPIYTKGRVLRVRDGELYLQRFPLFPVLVLPLYRWFGVYGLYVIPALAATASGVFALLLLDSKDRRLGMWVVIAFGSPLFVYATMFWEHTLATGLGLAAAWLALRMGSERYGLLSRRIIGWSIVGATLGVSIFLRLEMIIFSLALLAAYWVVARKDRWAPIFVLVGLGCASLLYVLVHLTLFGQPLPDNALYLFHPFLYLRQAGWRALPDLLIGPHVDEAINPGWRGDLWAFAAAIAIASSFVPADRSAASKLRLVGLALSVIAAASFLFTGTAYRSAHGLLFTTPWALLGICRGREVWQRGNWRARVVVLCTLFGLVGYAIGMVGLRASSPHGGLEWGARFALAFYPLLALMACYDLGPEKRSARTIAIVAAFMFLGIAFQTRGIWTIHHDKVINANLLHAIEETPDHHVVSDLWWMPLVVSAAQSEKAIYVTNGLDKLETWIQMASDRHLQTFSLVTLDASLPYRATQSLNAGELRVVGVHTIENLIIYRLAIQPKTH